MDSNPALVIIINGDNNNNEKWLNARTKTLPPFHVINGRFFVSVSFFLVRNTSCLRSLWYTFEVILRFGLKGWFFLFSQVKVKRYIPVSRQQHWNFLHVLSLIYGLGNLVSWFPQHFQFLCCSFQILQPRRCLESIEALFSTVSVKLDSSGTTQNKWRINTN